MAEKRRRLRAYRRAWSARPPAGAGALQTYDPSGGWSADGAAQGPAGACWPRGSTARTTPPASDLRALDRLGPADAGGTVAERPGGLEAERGAEALALLGYPWQHVLEGWTIEFLPGRPGLLGGTWTYEHRIEVYVRPAHTAHEVAFTLAHELGHAVDVVKLCDVGRARWRAARGIANDVPWWVESGATDFDSCSGDWAESFAVWQVGGPSASRAAGQPTTAQLRLLARLAT